MAALTALTLAAPATAAPDGWTCYSQYNQACVSQFGYTGQSTWGYPVDAWGNNCTNYAAFRLAANGATNPGNLGNADVWDDNARVKGIRVDQTPAVGSIAQWETMHVAYVDWVSPDGNQIAISETSYDIWLNGVHYVSSSGRRVLNRGGTGWPSDLEFIHLKDVPTDRDGPMPRPGRSRMAWGVSGSDRRAIYRRYSPGKGRDQRCLVHGGG
jgi:surface antigen